MKLKLSISRMAVVMACFFCMAVAYAAPVWEKVSSVQSDMVESVSEHIDVRVVDGAIVLTLDHKSTVKVFTILGQLVAQQQLDAGTWRLPIDARGIYILKAGSSTRRITI